MQKLSSVTLCGGFASSLSPSLVPMNMLPPFEKTMPSGHAVFSTAEAETLATTGFSGAAVVEAGGGGGDRFNRRNAPAPPASTRTAIAAKTPAELFFGAAGVGVTTAGCAVTCGLVPAAANASAPTVAAPTSISELFIPGAVTTSLPL